MAKQVIGIGSTAGDNTGDTLRVGGDKINDNFTELYSAIGNSVSTQISVTNAGTGQVLRYDGSGFVASDYSALTSSLDVNSNSIISSSNGNIVIAPNGTGNLALTVGGITSTFLGANGAIDIPALLRHKGEYTSLAASPSAADFRGYFFTVNGDDNPYVNINITTGGIGNTRAKLLTEYASIDGLADVDTTTAAPTANQVLKWNATDSKWIPAPDDAGLSNVNLFATVAGDTGSTTADSSSDTLTVTGGNDIVTSVVGDTITIDFNGSPITTFAGLTDTNTAGLAQGNSIFYDGLSWVRTSSPIIWWDLGSDGSSHYTFAGPGFASATNDPDVFLYRGFTYAFDNSVNGGSHPFRIQTSQGL